jgi:hypothetical protein
VDPATAASQNGVGTYQCITQINVSHNYLCLQLLHDKNKLVNFYVFFLMLSNTGFVA